MTTETSGGNCVNVQLIERGPHRAARKLFTVQDLAPLCLLFSNQQRVPRNNRYPEDIDDGLTLLARPGKCRAVIGRLADGIHKLLSILMQALTFYLCNG